MSRDASPYKLFYTPGTRATRVRWTLEELSLPYELVHIDLAKRENRTPHYLKLHPLGKVPAISRGEWSMFESTAICLHLADGHPRAGMAPPPGSDERATYFQWISYATQNLEPLIDGVYLRSFRFAQDRRSDTATLEERRALQPLLKPLVRELEDQDFILYDGFSTADIIVGDILAWAQSCGLLRDVERLDTYLARLKKRPVYLKAHG